MKSRLIKILTVGIMALVSIGCESEHRRTHRVVIEGPEKKTEVKVETKDKR